MALIRFTFNLVYTLTLTMVTMDIRTNPYSTRQMYNSSDYQSSLSLTKSQGRAVVRLN